MVRHAEKGFPFLEIKPSSFAETPELSKSLAAATGTALLQILNGIENLQPSL